MRTNAGEVSKQLLNDSKKLEKEMQKTLQKWGNSTIKKANRNRKWKRKSGNLDRAQKADVDGLNLRIWIDPDLVTNKGYNYGLIQHEGSKRLEGDPWLDRAVEAEKDKLEKMLLDDIEKVLG